MKEIKTILKGIEKDLLGSKRQLEKTEYGSKEYYFIKGRISQAENTIAKIEMVLEGE
jgi:5-bromo-4-chloroindolyl phosphate hydrolysis protein